MLVRSTMSSKEDFIYQVCNAFKKAVESASELTLEGREREFRHVLARFLFDELLGWEGHSKIGEIYDITCFDDENFPIIVIETKWDVKPTREIKEKLRKRIEELGSVKYGVFASERDFIIYAYEDYKLRETTKVNVAEAVGVAKGEYGLSEVAKRRILKIESVKRERLIWIEEPEYFEKTYKEVSVAKKEGVELLTENLKDVIRDLTTVLVNFFDSYRKRKDHYSGNFLESTFNDWLKLSMKNEDFKKGNKNQRSEIVKVFCRETAYVLLGKILFTRICEDKGITKLTISGKGLAESLRYYEERRKNPYLIIFDESREEIRKYYTHLYRLGYFDWWWISPEKIGVLSYEENRIQNSLEEDLNASIKKMLRRFNRFDFTQVDRDILGDVYQGYLPPEERKQLGEFYTPTEVIEYILDGAGYTSDNEIRGKKLLDPACGSGSFLVEATKRLIGRYRRIGFNYKDPDEAKQIIDECANSIYGLDIHPFACFIAEMNLLFQLVDLYDAVRQKYKPYKLPRINVYRTDSLAPSGETIELTEFFDNSRFKMLIEETKGADRIKSVKFDYVVGNPPYVRKERISSDYKEKILRKIYPEVYHGDNDLLVYFIAKGISWLKDEGKFGYIVSSKFTKTRYGGKIRKFITDTCCIEQFLDFGLIEVFKEVANLPAIIILNAESDQSRRAKCIIKVAVAKKEKGYAKETMDYIKANFEKQKYSDEYIDIFEVKQSFLGEKEWKLVPIETFKTFLKIRQKSDYPLKKICKVDRGIYTGLNEAFVVDNDIIRAHELETDLLKPLLRGADVRKYRILWNDLFLIYTKDIDINKYPKTNAFLINFRDKLEKRWCVTDPHMGRKWYELEKPREPTLFECKKIITPDISTRNNFMYDELGYCPLNTCYVIALTEEKRREYRSKKEAYYLKFLLGLLNSKVIEFYFKHISTFVLGRHYRYIKQYLQQIPIKEITNKNRYLAEEIVSEVRQILQLSQEKIGRFPDSYLENDWSFKKLSNEIRSQNLSKSSYSISEKSLKTHWLKDLDGREIFRINLAPGDYIDLGSEEVASYVLGVLRTHDRITKRELLELKTPQEPHLKNLLNQYQKDKERIVKNEKAVEELEKQIDDLVYKLYDITYKERRIIEEYLAKF